MRKIFLTLLAFCVGMSIASEARADHEFLETTMSFLENVQKKYQVIQEKYQKIESTYNQIRQGPLGVLPPIPSKFQFDKIPVRTIPILANNMDNIGKLEKAIKRGTVFSATGKDLSMKYAGSKIINQMLIREDWSRLIAYAISLRAKIAKNRKTETNDAPPEYGNDRQIKQALNKEVMEVAQRWTRILDMQSAMTEMQLELVKAGQRATPDDTEEGD